jgi:hypothetical protein
VRCEILEHQRYILRVWRKLLLAVQPDSGLEECTVTAGLHGISVCATGVVQAADENQQPCSPNYFRSGSTISKQHLGQHTSLLAAAAPYTGTRARRVWPSSREHQ